MREIEAGFTLIESLLAFVIAATMTVTAISVFLNSLERQHLYDNRYILVETARSILDEYVVTSDPRLRRGQFKDGPTWQVTETPVPHEFETRYSTPLSMVEISVTVRFDSDSREATLKQTVARRAQ